MHILAWKDVIQHIDHQIRSTGESLTAGFETIISCHRMQALSTANSLSMVIYSRWQNSIQWKIPKVEQFSTEYIQASIVCKDTEMYKLEWTSVFRLEMMIAYARWQ